ncbi:unnamed protein product [Caenorhabditis auriculariae]|uniref:Uncharacterized protein n=1 Tax=Caenorhabditis auriculariae TaxID=2777116 RepID=A0A8S1HZN3_9PELO|nr:unnamed protein product [Caenorhabditis auriculariae]
MFGLKFTAVLLLIALVACSMVSAERHAAGKVHHEGKGRHVKDAVRKHKDAVKPHRVQKQHAPHGQLWNRKPHGK